MKKNTPIQQFVFLWMMACATTTVAQFSSLPIGTSPGSASTLAKSDSLAKPGTGKPSLGDSTLSHADSLIKIAIRDSLLAEKSRHSALFKRFPTSLDSLYNPQCLYQPYLFTADAVGLSEAMRPLQQIVSVPFSLSSSMNRNMPYGFPLPATTMYSGNNIIGENTSALNGIDRVSCMQLSSVLLESPFHLRYCPYPVNLVSPETDVLWEHGVFSENIFSVRVARPLSDNINVAIFSDNRHFDRLTYGTKGDIANFYSMFVLDSTLLSQGGRTPLVDEQNSGIRIVSQGKNGVQSHLSLFYFDQSNEQSYESKDSLGKGNLQWERIFQYGTTASAGLQGLHIKPLFLNLESQLITGGNTLHTPLDTHEFSGRNNEYSFAISPYIPIFSDTLSAALIAQQHDQTTYNTLTPSALCLDGALAFVHHVNPWGHAEASVTGSIGQHYTKLDNGRHSHDWTWNIDARLSAKNTLVRAYSTRNFAPFPVMYDTANLPFNVYFDPYTMQGAEVFTWYKKVGLTTGICSVSGLSGADSSEFWPHNVLPYQQPNLSYMVSPLFGQWHGLSAASRWMFSDKKPYLKAQTSLSYQAHPLNWNEHILLDLVFDYWSGRDTLTYGGKNNWNREIYNVYFKTAVQIKTFSLFYKVDNILNRSFAYVPGYTMPGITFRWGFQWLIQG